MLRLYVSETLANVLNRCTCAEVKNNPEKAQNAVQSQDCVRLYDVISVANHILEKCLAD